MIRRATPAPGSQLFDPDLMLPSLRIVEGALGVGPADRMVILVDAERKRLGEALASAARDRHATALVMEIESLGPRPLPSLPSALRRELELAQVSVLLIGVNQHAEIPLRREWVDLVPRIGLRHAHMPGLGRRGFVLGFQAEASRIATQVRATRDATSGATKLVARSLAGTNVEVRLSPEYRWKDNTGVIRSARFENLPSGYVSTHPASVDGTFVADASLLGPQGIAEGMLGDRAVHFELEGGRCVRVTSRDPTVQRIVEQHLASEPDLDRVGQVIVGANLGITSPIGDPLFDQASPGLHLVFGFSLQRETGARWSSRGILTAMGAYADVEVDGKPLVTRGRCV